MDKGRGAAENLGEVELPFVMCQDRGGPYDSESVVAGFYVGMIWHALQVAAVSGALQVGWTVPTPTVAQIELIAMQQGYMAMHATPTDDPNWTAVLLAQTADLLHE